jgi:hypothetical protein
MENPILNLFPPPQVEECLLQTSQIVYEKSVPQTPQNPGQNPVQNPAQQQGFDQVRGGKR